LSLQEEAERFIPEFFAFQRGRHYLSLDNANGERPADIVSNCARRSRCQPCT
jgi:hypothetical protein